MGDYEFMEYRGKLWNISLMHQLLMLTLIHFLLYEDKRII
jgi:hypothetical protein